MLDVPVIFAIGIVAISSPLGSHALRLEAGQRIASRVPLAPPIVPAPIYTGPVSNHTEILNSQTTSKYSIFDLPRVEQWATQHDLQERHLKTIYQVAMKSSPSPSFADADVDDFAARLKQEDISHRHADAFARDFQLTTSRIVEQQPSASGGTKIVIELASGQLIETVLIRHERTAATSENDSVHDKKVKTIALPTKSNKEKGSSTTTTRYTVCVSSQVGCAKSCTFCATGTMGLLANLSSAEILEQVWLARSILPRSQQNQLRNLVFMGMGEPLDNYDAVHEACRGLTHQCLFGFKAKQVTISTVGDTPHRIRQLADEAPQISLALSLHGATQSLRSTLIPTARRAPLAELEAAMDYHARQGGRGIMLEYLLIDGINDTDEAADALIKFCQRAEYLVFVNLIPYNPTFAGAGFDYQTPSDERIDAFHTNLRRNGIRSLVRWSSANGRDTNGACGQLASSVSLRSKNAPQESRCTT